MASWWTVAWSFGTGRSRIYCGISRTAEGYAVDVFGGDTCLESYSYDTRADAVRAAQLLKRLDRTERRKGRAAAHI